MNQDNLKLDDVVIQLHDAARTVTNELGLTALSLDIRECADRLNELITIRSDIVSLVKKNDVQEN